MRNKGNAHGVTHGATMADASPALKRTYNSWKAMIQRTTNPKANRGRDWHRYGGCGVTVCEQWLHSFKNFLADLGERPAGTTLGRYGDIGNYEPGRCAWQTPAQQAAENNHRRKKVMSTAGYKRECEEAAADAATKLEITARGRLKAVAPEVVAVAPELTVIEQFQKAIIGEC